MKAIPDHIQRLPLFLLTLCSGLSWAADGHQVSKGAFNRRIVLSGQLSAAVAETVVAPKSDTWRVTIKWLIEEGTVVTPGQVVVRFDNSGLLEKVEGLEKEIENLQIERADKKTETTNTLRDLHLKVRTQEIQLEKAEIDAGIPKHLVSAKEFEEKALARTRAQKDLEIAQKELATKEANFLDEAEVLRVKLEYKKEEYTRQKAIAEAMEVRARGAGVVIYANFGWEERKIQVGDTLQATWDVMDIPDLTSLEVEAFVNETDLTLLKPGQNAVMQLDAYPQQPFSGRVLEVSRKGETREQWGKAAWFKVRVSLDELDPQRMRPGMSIRTAVNVSETAEALLIPFEAVRLRENTYYVTGEKGEEIALPVLGFDPFHFAVPLDGPLREGMVLR